MRASCTGPRFGARGGQKEPVDNRTKSEDLVWLTPKAASGGLEPAWQDHDRVATAMCLALRPPLVILIRAVRVLAESLRAELVPRFATYDNNGRHAASRIENLCGLSVHMEYSPYIAKECP